jgi:hypothetical protein
MTLLATASWQIYDWIWWTGSEFLKPWENILETKIPKHTKITPRCLVERRQSFGDDSCIIFQDAVLAWVSRVIGQFIQRNNRHSANIKVEAHLTLMQGPYKERCYRSGQKMLKPLLFQLCTFEVSKSHENTTWKYQLHRRRFWQSKVDHQYALKLCFMTNQLNKLLHLNTWD